METHTLSILRLLRQCSRETFMVHQTFIRWAVYILYKFVKSHQTFGPSHWKCPTYPMVFAEHCEGRRRDHFAYVRVSKTFLFYVGRPKFIAFHKSNFIEGGQSWHPFIKLLMCKEAENFWLSGLHVVSQWEATFQCNIISHWLSAFQCLPFYIINEVGHLTTSVDHLAEFCQNYHLAAICTQLMVKFFLQLRFIQYFDCKCMKIPDFSRIDSHFVA